MRQPALPDDRRAPLPDPRRAGRPLTGSPHAWFEDWLDACNRHDAEAVRALLHPDVRRTGAPRGADARLHELAELLTAFPDLRWRRITVVAEGDRAAAHLRTRGTHRGPWRDVRPTGRHVGWAEYVFVRLERGRAVELAGGTDPEEVLRQVGP